MNPCDALILAIAEVVVEDYLHELAQQDATSALQRVERPLLPGLDEAA